jgi:hypothetical protein
LEWPRFTIIHMGSIGAACRRHSAAACLIIIILLDSIAAARAHHRARCSPFPRCRRHLLRGSEVSAPPPCSIRLWEKLRAMRKTRRNVLELGSEMARKVL